MKVLLAAVNAKYIHSNPAVYSLQRYAQNFGCQVEMKEYTINQQTEEIMESIFRIHPDVLCFSCYIWNRSVIRELTGELKKVMPEMKIWLGGPEVTHDSVEVLKTWKGVTGVMRGEGEQTFLQLIQHYQKGGCPLEEISGITWMENGALHQNRDRMPMDLSAVPFPYEDLKDFENRIIYYESSRGCPFSCSYCLSSVDKRLRFRSLELVKKELAFFLEHQVPQVKFVDRTFNCKKEHSRAIWNYLLEHDNGITNFHFEVAADLLEAEDFAILNRMRPGLVQLEIGVQTTNLETLKEIRRTMDFSDVCEAVAQVEKAHNIHRHLDLIAGLPGEGLARFKQSFNDVYSLHAQQLQLGFLKVLKGSWMWENREAYGLVYRDREPYEVLETKWISYEELLLLKRVETVLEIYYNNGQFLKTVLELEKKFDSPFDFYEQLGNFYQQQGGDGISHSRMKRYEILLGFIQSCSFEDEAYLTERLTFDYYLRDNAKSRPSWASGQPFDTGELKQIYEELYDTVLAHYEGFDHRQIRRMTHLERFRFDVLGDASKRETWVLFDYRKRNPLTNDAACSEIGTGKR